MNQPVSEQAAVEPGEQHELSSHPGPTQYVGIAIVLAIVTAIEVAMSYIDLVRPILVPSLIVLAVIKFALVVLWFMHLRFDSRIFKRLFILSILLAVSLFAVVLVFFFTHGGPAPVAG